MSDLKVCRQLEANNSVDSQSQHGTFTNIHTIICKHKNHERIHTCTSMFIIQQYGLSHRFWKEKAVQLVQEPNAKKKVLVHNLAQDLMAIS